MNRKNIFKKIGLIILLALVVTSCEKWIDSDINVDPNATTDVPMNLLLPSVQGRVAFNIAGGNDIVRTTAIWTQQLTGIARQSQSEGSYTLRAGDVNNLWSACYAGALHDAKILTEKAQAEETRSAAFEGVGKIMTAFAYATMADVWNDVPMDEALLGDENPQPAFNTQQEIYTKVQTMLDEAISLLGNTGDDIFDLEGDLIYGGDTDMWIKAAYALKARYALQLSKKNGDQAYTDALNYIGNAFTSNADNMLYNYGGNPNDGNPLWLFMEQRGDVVMGSFLMDYLNETDDPRIAVLATPIADTIEYEGVTYFPGDYFGSRPDVISSDASLPGPAIASASSPTAYISYPELLFIKAEAEHMTGGDAATTLKSAVAASMEYYGIEDADWLTGYEAKVDGLSGDDLHKEIMMQKYVALTYSNPVYNDFRRTNNVIGITANPLGGDEFPKRFPYASDPVTFNQNTPTDVDIFQRVWWDN